MGWNQSHDKKPTAKSFRVQQIAFIAVLLAVLVGVTCWLLRSPGEMTTRDDVDKKVRKSKSIAQARPQIKDTADSTDGEDAASVEEQSKPAPLPPQRVGELRDGYRLLPSGRLHRVLGTISSRDTSNEWLEKAFPEPSDQLIAGLITIEPGETLIGDPESYFRNFSEQFQASLLNPIRIEKDDDPYIRELKEAVKATRDELVSRLKAGEDIVQIMVDTRKQYQELGLYRNELREIVRKSLEDGEMTSAEYEDLVKAANMMLDERGSKHLDLPETFKKYVDMMGIDIDETEADE